MLHRKLMLIAAILIISGCTDEGDTTNITQVIAGANGTGGGGFGPAFAAAPDVVFLADRNVEEVMELWAANYTGTSLVNLSGPLAAGGTVVWFEWAPDRQKVAFLASKDVPGRHELYVVQASGGTPVKVSVPLGVGRDVARFFFAWSPDSLRLAYAADDIVDGELNAFVVLASGGLSTSLGSFQQFSFFAWSPDSQRLAFASDTNELRIASVSGGQPVTASTTVYTSTGAESTIAWAPDGSRLAFLEEAGGALRLSSALPNGSGLAVVSGTPVAGGGVDRFKWAPDSSRIAYLARQDVSDQWEVFTSLPGGGGNVQVSAPLIAAGDVDLFLWAPDSSRIAYIADQDVDEELELYTALPPGGGAVQVSGTLESGSSVMFAEWSPDSSRIGYNAWHDGAPFFGLHTVLPGGGGLVEVAGTLAAGGDVLNWIWAPDSSRVAYIASPNLFVDPLELYTAPAAAAASSVRISGTMSSFADGVFGFGWTPDSTRVVYDADQEAPSTFALFVSQAMGGGNMQLTGDSPAWLDVPVFVLQ